MSIPRLTAALIIGAMSTPVLAWGPYGPPALPGAADPFWGPPGMPAPFAAPYGFEAPPMPPSFAAPEAIEPRPESATPAAPGSWPWSAPPGRERATPFRPAQSGLVISQQATPEAYLVEIDLTDLDPAQVRIMPRRHGIAISYRTDSRGDLGDQIPGGYRYGYNRSSSVASRHIRLPADADLSAMSREQTSEVIRLRIPRVESWGSAPWSGPAWPDQRPAPLGR